MKSADPTRTDTLEYSPQRNAWLKAIRLEEETVPEWDKEYRCWIVPSNSDPTGYHGVWERQHVRKSAPWWDRLNCTCPAAAAGRVTCWHRARVALLWTREGEVVVPHTS